MVRLQTVTHKFLTGLSAVGYCDFKISLLAKRQNVETV